MLGFKKNKKKIRADTSYKAYFMSDREDILPIGYTKVKNNEEVRLCANRIADLVSSMTIMLMQNGEKGDRRIKNELSRIIDIEPNETMIRKTFIHKIVVDMVLNGNAVAVPEYSYGKLLRQTILNADQLVFEEKERTYLIRCNTASFDQSEVLHFPFIPDDDKPFKGVGYVDQIKTTVENLVQANATKSSFLRSKWKPPLIISIQADEEFLQDPEKRKEILGSYRDDTEEGEPWIIPAGEIDVKSVQPLTLNDLAIQDGITLDKRSVAAAFGMPPFMVGVGEFNKTAYNNFISTTIMPIAMVIQQEYTRKISPRDDWYFKLNPRSLMQYDIQELTNHVTNMVTTGMLNRNEGRSEFDYAPVDAPGMDDYAVLENYIPIDKIEDQKKLVQKGGVLNEDQ
ncbi:phage portal protein [Clostridium sp. HBUAS56010]|uniref:phage portal protein n=1 Tax=Clostridium sp. HBUAS56010 TaxID=2571127 RepID=UPI001FA99343|nr:phage portal protein [Clostridium sp. HBUAS56010]